MKYNLHSEHIKQRLFWSMVIIIGSIFFISVPLTLSSYKQYQESKNALAEISILKNLTDLSNLISRERAPTNNAMSSSQQTLPKSMLELQKSRIQLDKKIDETIQILNQNNYSKLADQLEYDLKVKLKNARETVDHYIESPPTQRSTKQFDYAIQQMYIAWGAIRQVLENFMMNSTGKTSELSNYYTIILLLTDLRDQAGRVASNIIAPLTYREKMPDENIARSLQTQHQANYLWNLINTLQPEELKTEQYLHLHRQVKEKFIDKSLPIVEQLISDSEQGVPYSFTAIELTNTLIDKYATVVRLQAYIINNCIPHVQNENNKMFRQFILSIVVSLISLITALFTLIYARDRIFVPLIEARQKILMLASKNNDGQHAEYNDTSISLFEAIQRLHSRLQQRDILEFQLHNIANTDALTGVSNRLALEQYVKLLDSHTEKLQHTGLIILDIDDFKKVNDSYGHIIGDQVIQFVANKLKSNLRTSDVIVRYGGDEFIIILDSIDAKDTVIVADKIRLDISESEFVIPETGKRLQISVSAGVAVGATTWKELFDRADKSLFKVKVKGKNAVSE